MLFRRTYCIIFAGGAVVAIPVPLPLNCNPPIMDYPTQNGAGHFVRPAPRILQPNSNAPRLENQSKKHQDLIKALILALQNRHGVATTHASFPGYSEPEKMGRHEPDTIGQDQTGLIHIGEAKTGDNDLSTPQAKEQFIDFSQRTMKSDGRSVPFHIIVPKDAEPKLVSILNELGLISRPNVVRWVV